MSNMSELYTGKYFNASDIKEPTKFTISKVQAELVGQGERAKQRAVVYLEGQKKTLVLNKTNYLSLMKKLGENNASWVGQEITLAVVATNYQGQAVEGIRVL